MRLLGRPTRRLRWSPSCVVLHLGAATRYAGAAHHNLHFGAAWRSTFEEVTRRGELMRDPSLLVTCPTTTDPDLAPAGRSTFYVLAPVPNLEVGRLDWVTTGPRYRDELVGRLERMGYVGLGDAVDVERLVTPREWAALGLAAGTPFSAAHLFRQTGPFRPRNLVADNVVLAGSGTHPGVGVPMVLVSGRLAAQRITG
jgi:phytoene desaturase